MLRFASPRTLLSLFAGGAALIFAAVLLHLDRDAAETFESGILKATEHSNDGVVTALRHLLDAEIDAVMAPIEPDASAGLRAAPWVAIDGAVRRIATGTPILKIKLFSSAGQMIFSTRIQDIAESHYDNVDIRAALAGERASRIQYRESFLGIDGVVLGRYVASSYLPLRKVAGSADTDGAIEVYSDVTEPMRAMAATLHQHRLTWAATFGLLYAVLLAFAGLAVRVVSREGRRTALLALERAQSQTRFRDAIESVPDGLALFDRHGRPVEWNAAYARMFPAEPAGREGGGRTAPGPLPRRPGITDGGAEVRLPDGREVEVVERRTADGGTVALCRDVTQARRVEAEIRRLLEAERAMNEQQSRFVSMASHEFRTPLAIIDGSAQLLARAEPIRAFAPAQTRIGRIRAAVVRMTELMDTMSTSAKLARGTVKPELRALDLAALVGAAIERQRALAPDFEIETDLAAAGAVAGDERLLDQVFSKLLANAVKYSGESRRVVVRARAERGGVAVEFRDYGIGIPDAELPRVFERFFRASNTAGIPGSGVGLNVARQIAALHRGEVTVARPDGPGTAVTVWLPCAAQEAARAAPEPRRASA